MADYKRQFAATGWLLLRSGFACGRSKLGFAVTMADYKRQFAAGGFE